MTACRFGDAPFPLKDTEMPLPVLPLVRPPEHDAVPPARMPAPVYERLGALWPGLGLEVVAPGAPARPGWTDGEALLADPALLGERLAAEAGLIRERCGRAARPDVVATKVLHSQLWAVCLLMGGPWYLHRRVAPLRPADIRVEPATGRFGVVPAEFVCLADDPAASLPGVRVASGPEALRAELRSAVVEHARPLLAAFGPHVRRGPHALWGMVGDDLVSAVWNLGRALGHGDRAVTAATELLPGPLPPFPRGATFRAAGVAGAAGVDGPDGADGAGCSEVTMTRLACCLHYTVEPEAACAACPRLRAVIDRSAS